MIFIDLNFWRIGEILFREIYEVETDYGKARVEIAWRDGFCTVQPEYEDCAKLARSHNIPLIRVQDAVKSAGEIYLQSRNLTETLDLIPQYKV